MTMIEFNNTTEALKAMEQAEHAVYLAEARDPETPADELEALADDESAEIREAVANNPSTPFAALGRLMEDRDHDVMGAAFGNPSGPGALVREMRSAKNSPTKKSFADAIRKDLRKAFPGIKFSFRNTVGVGPIDITWNDGPSDEQVEAVIESTLTALNRLDIHCSLYHYENAA